MTIKMIHWRLREVMASRGISATDLAASMGLSKNSISNLRGSEMPRINEERLNSLMLSLNSLRRANSELITLSELIQFSLTPEEMKALGID